MTSNTWRTVAIVVAIVVAVNLASYFYARRALAQSSSASSPSDGGPTGRARPDRGATTTGASGS